MLPRRSSASWFPNIANIFSDYTVLMHKRLGLGGFVLFCLKCCSSIAACKAHAGSCPPRHGGFSLLCSSVPLLPLFWFHPKVAVKTELLCVGGHAHRAYRASGGTLEPPTRFMLQNTSTTSPPCTPQSCGLSFKVSQETEKLRRDRPWGGQGGVKILLGHFYELGQLSLK